MNEDSFWVKALSVTSGGPLIRVTGARVRHHDGTEEDLSHESVVLGGNIAFSPDGFLAKDDTLIISYEVEMVHPDKRNNDPEAVQG